MRPSGRCDFHRGPSGTARLVELTEQDDGKLAARYACRPCREQRRLPDIDTLHNRARIRAAVTGETIEEAAAALRGEHAEPEPAQGEPA